MPRCDPKTILLVHPLGRSSGASRISRLANIMPPLGLASIAAWLERQGFAAHILDCYARPDADSELARLLQELSPGWVGFSCTTATFHDGVRLAGLVKAGLPEARTVMGGVHVSGQPGASLEQAPALDFVIFGEGEQAMAELMAQDTAPADIPGLAWRDEAGEVRVNARRTRLLDLDDLPFPAYGKLQGFPGAYSLPLFNYPRAPGATLTSSRGCPYACSYCDRSVFRRSYRYNSAQYLYEHLAHLRRDFGVRHVNIYDDQFTFKKDRVERFCELLLHRPLGVSFNCAVRADHVDPELLRLLKRAGCWMVSLGIESGEQALLDGLNRPMRLEQAALTVRRIKAAGLRAKGLLMLGLPGETRETMARTKNFALSLGLDDVNMAKFTPFPGAPAYRDICQHGDFDEDWDRMDCMHFLFVPHGLTREELEAGFTDFYKSFYTSPRAMADKVSMLWRSPDSWRRFLAHLPQFLRFARQGERYA